MYMKQSKPEAIGAKEVHLPVTTPVLQAIQLGL